MEQSVDNIPWRRRPKRLRILTLLQEKLGGTIRQSNTSGIQHLVFPSPDPSRGDKWSAHYTGGQIKVFTNYPSDHQQRMFFPHYAAVVRYVEQCKNGSC